MEVSSALASQKTSAVLAAVLKRVHRSLVAGVAFVVVLVLGCFALGSVVAAAMKPFDPEHIGLWTSAHGAFFIGSVSNPAGYTEHLGAWIYPFALASVVIAWVLGRLVLLWALRTGRKRA
jgi:hypothetical protein